MKNLVLGSVALIAIGVSIPVPAADMAVKAPPPSAPAAPYNWSGLYVGGNFGGAWTSVFTIPSATDERDDHGNRRLGAAGGGWCLPSPAEAPPSLLDEPGTQIICVDERVNEFESNIIWRTADLLGVSSRQRIELRQQVAADRAALNPV
jgi:hypothetical protein